MKLGLVALICTLVVGHTRGYYVPANSHDYYIDSPPVAEESKDVKYKFDFGVEEPKVAEPDTQMKSYGYAIETPASEPKADDTKYKFDYTLQKPIEEKYDEPEQRTMFTKIDRITQDKAECACKADKPCSCGYSPEQCAVHCSKSRPCDSGYVLPVRYDNNGGDYVVYELPQDASTQQLSRVARQTPTLSDTIQDLLSRDSPFKAAVDQIRDRISKLRRNDDSESTLGSTLDTSALRSKLTDRISSITDFFTQNFALPPLPTRRRREAPTTETERRELMDKRIPMLRVKEYEANPGNYDDLSKYTTTSRVKLPKSDDQQKTMSGKESDGTKHCHECGTELSNSVCTRCGSHQSQYVEYSTGKPLPFYPGAKSVTQPTVESPRYIFDRYGHKYIENNGNLRLIVPQQHQEAMVGDQPDFAGLADILNGNHEIIRQLNPAPGRVLPEPMDIATDAISLVHDLANREPEKRSTKYERAPAAAAAAEEDENEKKSERHFPRTMYQVVPMRYEGKDGKLVVKVYSSKSDKANTISAATTAATDAEKSKPTVHMFNKDNKQFEILSFEDYKNGSNEDIRRVLEHLHGKQSW